RTLALAEELGDAAVEAQACYSLGNTYTLLREYRTAEEYHARHLSAARKLQDRVGEGRACWSLGNAHAALGNHEKALYYAKEHYNISEQITPDAKKKEGEEIQDREMVRSESEEGENPTEMFMKLVERCQSSRMDEQRATLDKE
ncbi:jg120, partial [Pararge aegeria aegeria]